MRALCSESAKVPHLDLRPCSKVLHFACRKGCSKRNTAVIVRLFSVFARSEAVYDMHSVPLCAVFLHQGSRKGHRLRPTGRSVSWYLRLLWPGHEWSGNGMLSNMSVLIIWARMF